MAGFCCVTHAGCGHWSYLKSGTNDKGGKKKDEKTVDTNGFITGFGYARRRLHRRGDNNHGRYDKRDNNRWPDQRDNGSTGHVSLA